MASTGLLLGALVFLLHPFTSFSEKFASHHEYCVVGAGPGGMFETSR